MAGENYPVAPVALDVGGVSFDLTTLDAVPNSLGIIQTDFDSRIVIPTNVFGATKVYTLINSIFGRSGRVDGYVEFFGTVVASASFELQQGWNIRDHYNGSYNNVVNDPTIVPVEFGGGVRLDRQTFVLPTSFASETLTEIHLVDTTPGLGRPFLAAVAVEAVPEPISVAIWGMLAVTFLFTVGCRRKTG